ncbi:exo-alpha-sialidase [Mangrovicoccus ximenensis]|uniref:exo-alpha-sialidase n=1 Tax=Mangrovicoccus ximenensis TaxID=1911570 RepID=UPI000D33E8C2|nr:exo-alpha-sialidase [Mangrovicoccus ximenensis]
MTADTAPGTSAEDAELLAAYAAGDPQAARMLMLRIAPRIHALAVRMLGDRAEAEDVTQEAMLRLWKIAPDWRHRAAAGPGGTGWSVPEAVDVPNNNSSIAAARLASGEIAMICNPVNAAMSQSRRASLYDELGEEDDRPDADTAGGCVPVWGVERAPVALCLSGDDGRSFPERYLVEDGPGTCLSNNSVDGKNRELSYPWLLETPDGCLHLSYTFHRRAIKHVRLAPGWRNRLPRL